MIPKPILYVGHERAAPEPMTLRAGPLSMVFEPDSGFVRYIHLGDTEALRGVYAAVRDRNWNTITPRISNLTHESGRHTFRVRFDVDCRERDIDFFWRGELSGDADGTIRFAMEGEARSSFLRNRIGFCVLHPMEPCAGRPCRVEHTDGSIDDGAFPDAISPHQPFFDIRAITHEVVPGVRVEVRMEGDVFEMEDQRNWTDATYKTYCTPLGRPYPVQIEKGTKVRQSVTLKLHGSVPAEIDSSSDGDGVVDFVVDPSAAVTRPTIGLGMASHGEPLGPVEIRRLRSLRLDHLRVDLRLSDPEFRDALHQATTDANALDVGLEAAVIVTDEAESQLRALAEQLELVVPNVVRWLVFHEAEKSTTAKWIRLARTVLARRTPRAAFGGGTNMYFTELNRGRPPVADIDVVCYSINPQVHAFDNASLVETLSAQGATVRSTRRFSGALPIAVTPVTFRPRFNPNATGAPVEPGPDELPSTVDDRQPSLFAAGWTLGSLKHLAQTRAASVTYYETTGWRGVMETDEGSPRPKLFRSQPGTVFPVYHVLADFAEPAGAEVLTTRSTARWQVEGTALRHGEHVRILLANLGAKPQTVRVRCPRLPASVRVSFLDETNAEAAMRSPEAYRARAGESLAVVDGRLEVALRPYGLARIEATRASG